MLFRRLPRNGASLDQSGAEYQNTGASWRPTYACRRQSLDRPYLGNVNAARLFAALHRLSGEARYATLARETLAGVAKPRTLRDRGRMIGTFLVALAEARALVWK